MGTWGTFSNYGWDDPSKLAFVQRCQDFCVVTRDSRNLQEAWQGNMDAFRIEARDQVSLSCCHSDIRFLINFQKESVNITF